MSSTDHRWLRPSPPSSLSSSSLKQDRASRWQQVRRDIYRHCRALERSSASTQLVSPSSLTHVYHSWQAMHSLLNSFANSSGCSAVQAGDSSTRCPSFSSPAWFHSWIDVLHRSSLQDSDGEEINSSSQSLELDRCTRWLQALQQQQQLVAQRYAQEPLPDTYLHLEQVQLCLSSILQALHMLCAQDTSLLSSTHYVAVQDGSIVQDLILTIIFSVEHECNRLIAHASSNSLNPSIDTESTWVPADAMRLLLLFVQQHGSYLPISIRERLTQLIQLILSSKISYVSSQFDSATFEHLSQSTSYTSYIAHSELLKLCLQLDCLCINDYAVESCASQIRKRIAIIDNLSVGLRHLDPLEESRARFYCVAVLEASLQSLLFLIQRLMHDSTPIDANATSKRAIPSSHSDADTDVSSILSCLQRILGWGLITVPSQIVHSAIISPETGFITKRFSQSQSLRAAHVLSPFANDNARNPIPQANINNAGSSQALFSRDLIVDNKHSNFLRHTEQCRGIALDTLHFLLHRRLANVHEHWLMILPLDANSAVSHRPFSGAHLCTIILYDPATRNRSLAAQCLSLLIPHSPLTRFVLIGGKAGLKMRSKWSDLARGLHSSISFALEKEREASVISALLQCASMYAKHIPYSYLQSSDDQSGHSTFLQPILMRAMKMLTDMKMPYSLQLCQCTPLRRLSHSRLVSGLKSLSPGSSIRKNNALDIANGALTASEYSVSAVSSQVIISTLLHILSIPFPHNLETVACLFDHAHLAEIDTFVTALLQDAHSATKFDVVPNSWTLLSCIAQHHPNLLARYWQPQTSSLLSVKQLINDSLCDSRNLSRGVAALCMLSCWVTVGESINDDDFVDDTDQHPNTSMSPSWAFPAAEELICAHLPALYMTLIDSASHSPSQAHTGRARIVQVLAHIPESLWIKLEEKHQHAVFQTMQLANKDSVSAVRICAAQAQAHFLTMSSFCGTQAWSATAVDSLVQMLSHENAQHVRTRAAWSLATACECKNDGSAPSWWSITSVESRTKLLQATKTALQTEKAAAAAMRVVANMLKWLDSSYFEQVNKFLDPACLTDSLTAGLSKQQQQIKCRWNAANAIGILLSNTNFISLFSDAQVEQLVRTLSHVAVGSDIFNNTNSSNKKASSSAHTSQLIKVRICAAAALQLPRARHVMGKNCLTNCILLFFHILQELTTAVSTIRFQLHMDVLEAQLQCTFFHLLAQLDNSDVVGCDSELMSLMDFISHLALKERLRLYSEAQRSSFSKTKPPTRSYKFSQSQDALHNETLVTMKRPTVDQVELAVNKFAATIPNPVDRKRFLAAANGE